MSSGNTEGKAEQGVTSASYVAAMQGRHPAVSDAEAERWTVQQRNGDGIYQDVLRTADAHEANELFKTGTKYRVLDTALNEVAADYVPLFRGIERTPDEKPAGWDVEYPVRSPFREIVDTPEHNSVVDMTGRSRYETIDIDEALETAKGLREKDRAAITAERGHLQQEIDAGQHRVKFLDRDATRQDRGNDMDELAGRTPAHQQQAMTEHEKNRRIELVQQVHQQFRAHGAEFRFKDQPSKIAFRDAGDALKSSSNDERVAKAMATMADAKGWKTISVSGHPDFKREVWLEASLRGIEVRGFKPQEQDLKDLATLRERQQRNSIEHVPERTAGDRAAQKDRQPERAVPTAAEKAAESRQEPREPSPPREAAERSRRASSVSEGILVAHGAAPYKNDPKESPSYYVTLATERGLKTIWSVDLARAVNEADITRGDAVSINHAGSKPVTIEAVRRDAQGKVIGHENIDTHRNQWEVVRSPESERARLVNAVAAAVMADKVKDPMARDVILAAIADRVQREDQAGRLPPVRVYDHTAPIQGREADRTRPQVERHSERTR